MVTNDDKGKVRKDEGRSHSKIRVRYADTDAQGIVYHGAFFTFFEVARFEFILRLLGSEGEASVAWNCLAIASARCDYKAPVRFPEVVMISASVSRVGTSSFELAYQVADKNDAVVAEGATVQVCLGPGGRATPLPTPLKAPVRHLDAGRQRCRGSIGTLMRGPSPTNLPVPAEEG